jgi:hypothetical protein
MYDVNDKCFKFQFIDPKFEEFSNFEFLKINQLMMRRLEKKVMKIHHIINIKENIS